MEYYEFNIIILLAYNFNKISYKNVGLVNGKNRKIYIYGFKFIFIHRKNCLKILKSNNVLENIISK